MRNLLISVIILIGAAGIVYRTLKLRLHRICLLYAAGIAGIAVCTLLTGRMLNICAAAPLFTLALMEQRKKQRDTNADHTNPAQGL